MWWFRNPGDDQHSLLKTVHFLFWIGDQPTADRKYVVQETNPTWLQDWMVVWKIHLQLQIQ